jgi:predicted nucleic acid-binding protein
MSAEAVDASALAALLFGEPKADLVAEYLSGADLFAPSLIRYELASVCDKKRRLYPAQQDLLLAAIALYPRLGVAEVEVPATEMASLARDAEVTAYDAAYLWVARHAKIPLLTLDRKLAAAARTLGLKVVGT